MIGESSPALIRVFFFGETKPRAALLGPRVGQNVGVRIRVRAGYRVGVGLGLCSCVGQSGAKTSYNLFVAGASCK